MEELKHVCDSEGVKKKGGECKDKRDATWEISVPQGHHGECSNLKSRGKPINGYRIQGEIASQFI